MRALLEGLGIQEEELPPQMDTTSWVSKSCSVFVLTTTPLIVSHVCAPVACILFSLFCWDFFVACVKLLLFFFLTVAHDEGKVCKIVCHKDTGRMDKDF